MITDALAGKIDMIIVKSISRFARNKVDSIQTNNKYIIKLCVINAL